MKIDIRTVVTGLTGDKIPADSAKPDGPALSYGHVLQVCLLAAAYPPGSVYTPEQAVERWSLAMAIEKAREPDADGKVDISVEMASALKVEVARNYGPIVSGPVCSVLDGNSAPLN